MKENQTTKLKGKKPFVKPTVELYDFEALENMLSGSDEPSEPATFSFRTLRYDAASETSGSTTTILGRGDF